MLRCNKKRPNAWQKTLSYDDPKRTLLSNALQDDPRVNFVCLDFPDFVEHTSAFTSGEEQLNDDLE
jgi:hypothetical protein